LHHFLFPIGTYRSRKLPGVLDGDATVTRPSSHPTASNICTEGLWVARIPD